MPQTGPCAPLLVGGSFLTAYRSRSEEAPGPWEEAFQLKKVLPHQDGEKAGGVSGKISDFRTIGPAADSPRAAAPQHSRESLSPLANNLSQNRHGSCWVVEQEVQDGESL